MSEVFALKTRLEKATLLAGEQPDLEAAIDILKLLEKEKIDRHVLKSTDIGILCNKLKKFEHAPIAERAGALIAKWRDAVKSDAPPAVVKPPSASASVPVVASSTPAVVPPPLKRTSGSTDSVVSAASSSSPISASTTPTVASVSSSSAAAAAAAAAQRASEAALQTHRTGTEMRNKIQTLLLGVFGERTDPSDADPVLLAVQCEAALHQACSSPEAYREKYKEIASYLRDPKNMLKQRLLKGEVKPDDLPRMSKEDMASEEQLQRTREIEAWVAEVSRSDNKLVNGTPTDEFTCSKCKKNKTVYYQKQTRSADEPMTVFLTCVTCGHKWRMG